MKQQTAMQIFISDVQETLKDFKNHGEPQSEYNQGAVDNLNLLVDKATELLTKEREQHTKTYTAGFYAGCDQPMLDNMPVDYFNNQYKQ